MKKHGWLWLVLGLMACGGGGASSGGGDDDLGDDELSFDTSGDEVEPGHEMRGSAIEMIGINPPERPWSEMSHEEKEWDMVGRFQPIFAELFRTHDADEFPEVGCETCHGDDMRDREFAMPNPSLPPVPPASSPAYEIMRDAHPEDMQFMEEHVTPAMQTMLGMGATFTCNGCHPGPGSAEVPTTF